ncbi:MAG TPA: metallophosphoesterase [Chitinophagaceae bacterium]|nr:metallophosphoesterase [Chitinophagaceae bacterium]
MRKLLQRLFKKPVARLAEKLSSSPKKEAVFKSLSALLEDISVKAKRGVVLPCELNETKFIIFSDMHKGARDLADDFRLAEKNYLTALNYYLEKGYTLVCLGDCEELWENQPDVLMKFNKECFAAESKFLELGRYIRTFGNHDLEWKYDIPRMLYLKPVFTDKLVIHEGAILKIPYKNEEYKIFLTHGHQGDSRSDGNAFSKWFVAAIWTPIQRFLDVSINTISDSIELVDKHNIIMYQWSATQKNLLFISGHTHKPVFASLDHVERLTYQLSLAKEKGDIKLTEKFAAELEKRKGEYAGKRFHKTMTIPSYFNSGCCCFADGDITGIEIADGNICLVKWEEINNVPARRVLESSPLSYIFEQLNSTSVKL